MSDPDKCERCGRQKHEGWSGRDDICKADRDDVSDREIILCLREEARLLRERLERLEPPGTDR